LILCNFITNQILLYLSSSSTTLICNQIPVSTQKIANKALKARSDLLPKSLLRRVSKAISSSSKKFAYKAFESDLIFFCKKIASIAFPKQSNLLPQKLPNKAFQSAMWNPSKKFTNKSFKRNLIFFPQNKIKIVWFFHNLQEFSYIVCKKLPATGCRKEKKKTKKKIIDAVYRRRRRSRSTVT